MADGLKKNDPYREMEDSRKSDITPGFVGGNKSDAAKNELNNLEADAADQDGEGGLYRGGGGVLGAKEREESGGGLYRASVGKGKGKGKGKGRFTISGKGKGLLFGLIFMVFGVGGAMSLTQSFQPFSLVANLVQEHNSMQTSASLRSASFFKMQMNPAGRNVPDGVNVKNPVKGRIFSSDTFTVTKDQAKKLSVQGIEYDDDYKYADGAKSARVFKYFDDEGKLILIAADSKVASEIGDGAVDFKSYYANNDGFSSKYDSGSMTWRGAIANWFGSLTKKFLQSNNLTRNMFENYRKKVEEADVENRGKVAQDILAGRTDEVEGGSVKRVDINKTEDGDDVDFSSSEAEEKIDGFNRKNMVDPSEAKAKITSVADKVTPKISETADKAVGNASQVVNVACTVMNVVGAISLLVSASEALQIINLTTGYFETVDKTKSGDGSDAPINELSNALNEKVENKNEVLEKTGVAWNDNDQMSNFIKTLTTKEVTTKKSAMQSSAVGALFGNGKVDTNDASVQSFNMSSGLNRILGGLGTSMTMFKTCALSKLAVSLAGGVKDAIEVAACIASAIGAPFTFGASLAGCGPLIYNTIKGIATAVAIGIVVSAVVGVIAPMAGKALTRDLVSNIGGEDLGNALVSGSLMYQGGNHRANGGSLSNREKYIAYAAEQEKVIAQNARYERLTLSPFDMTSNNTFMGVLLTKLMSFVSSSTLMDVITASSSAVTSSVVAMTPTASAYDINETLPTEEEYEDTCPYLASIGAVGDAFCNPYVVTDTTTIEADPLAIVNVLDNNFDGETSDGNVVIDNDSDLAKYITFCDQRESAFGIADQNIVNAVTAGSTGSSVADSAIGAIPVIGDAIDVVGNSTAVANVGYVGGESCVAGNTIDQENAAFSASPGWDTAKYYQRFIEDQALAESMGLIEQSAVSAFLDEYYEENPLDNSYEGMLARKSGLDKDTVVALLDIIDYGNYIAEYDPTERYTFGEPAVEDDGTLLFDNENTLASDVVLLNVISFADVRNRSFAA